MDNFFELLPFIIGILYFVFGGRKKKKESPKPNHRQPKRTSNTPSIEDILKELTGESSQRRPEPEPVHTPDYELDPWESAVDERIRVSEENATDVYVDQYDHNADTGESIEKIHEEILEEQHLVYDTNERDFDLRTAIINEAILNRPYQ